MTTLNRVSRTSGLLCALVLLMLLSLMSWVLLTGLEQHRRGEAQEAAQAFALRLIERFTESLGAVYLLSNALDRSSGEVRQFEETANELLRDFPLVRALQFAPNGIIRYVTPLRGNEVIVGHDLLIDKTRNKEVHLAISRRQMTVAGPFALRQGGLAIVARYPLFVATEKGPPRFWGLAIGVVDYPALLRVAGDGEFDRLGLDYQLCRVPPGDTACVTPNGDAAIVPASAEWLRIASTHADWRLAVYRPAGWLTTQEIALAVLVACLGSLLGGWLASTLVTARESTRSNAKSSAASLGQCDQR